MLFISYIDKRIWAIPYETVKNNIKITIGLKKSKYNIYELTKNNIIEKLNHLYDNISKFKFQDLNTPICKYQNREKEYSQYSMV